MLEINLLPGAGARGAAAPGRVAAVGAGVPSSRSGPAAAVAVAGLLVGLWIAFTFWSTGARAAELEQQIQKEVADSANLAVVIGRGALLRAREDTIQRKLDVIAQVDGRRYIWPHLLDEISRAVPASTWLTKLAATETAPPAAPAAGAPPADSTAPAPAEEVLPSFSIEGAAVNTQALTRFMRNLEASPFITGVSLVTTGQQAAEGPPVQQFTLEARYEDPDSALVQTVPVVTAP